MDKNNIKNKKGSVLVYSMIILSIMLISGMAIASTTILAKKGAISNDKSVQAFQLAESGLEILLKDIKDTQDITMPSFNVDKIKDVGDQSDSACDGSDCDAACSGGTLTMKISAISSESSDKVEMTFEDSSGSMNCDGSLVDIKNIKSIGIFQGVSRAIGTTATGS